MVIKAIIEESGQSPLSSFSPHPILVPPLFHLSPAAHKSVCLVEKAQSRTELTRCIQVSRNSSGCRCTLHRALRLRLQPCPGASSSRELWVPVPVPVPVFLLLLLVVPQPPRLLLLLLLLVPVQGRLAVPPVLEPENAITRNCTAPCLDARSEVPCTRLLQLKVLFYSNIHKPSAQPQRT